MSKLQVSEQDRMNEKATIELLNKVYGPGIVQTEALTDPFDAVGNGMVFEITYRKFSKTRYKTIVRSRRKIEAMRAAPGKAFFVPVLTDGTLIVDVKTLPTNLTTVMGGRTDRGLVNDVELMVHIPVSMFKELTYDSQA